MQNTLILAGGIVALVVVIGVVILRAYSKLYMRAMADEALVRTGRGGMKVGAGEGMWCIPIFHEMRRVSLRQMKIPIDRTGQDALVAQDMIKADVRGTMYVRVGDDEEDIKQAAKTFEEVSDEEINEMIAGKVTDAMRAEAMKLDYADLHVKKQLFAEAIGKAVAEDLKKTGLVLDTVAIESIQQVVVDPEHIPMDVFEAQGAKNVVQVVEAAREATNKIRREKQIAIQTVDVETRKQALALEQAEKFAVADQAKEVAEYNSTRQAEAKQKVYEQNQAAEASRISQEEEIQKREIQKGQAIAVQEATKKEKEEVAQTKASQVIEQAAIDKAKAIETARIAKERGVEAATIEKQQAIETAKVAKEQAIETATVEKQKAIAEAKELEAQAKAKQATAEALQEKESQSILTVTETEQADRARKVAVIKAEEKARQEVIDAEAERDSRKAKAEAEAQEAEQKALAAENQARGKAQAAEQDANAVRNTAKGAADAIKTQAEGHAADVSIRAKADAEAATLQAQAKTELAAATLAEGKAQAESKQLMVQAENAISDRILLQQAAIEAIRVAPEVVTAFMSPAAAIGEIKVLQVQGLGGNGGAEGSQVPQGLPGMLANSLAQSAGLTPVIKEILSFAREAGITGKIVEVGQNMAAEVKNQLGSSATSEDTPNPPPPSA